MPEWSPQMVVGEELARVLVGDLVPGLREAPMRLLGEGWDSTVWLVDGEWVFRFPRREVVIAGFVREIEVLPQAAPRLPLPVPLAVHRGHPDDRFAWPWAGFRLLPGRELADAAPPERDRTGHGRALGRFLRALHDIDPGDVAPAAGPLPVDPVRRADMPFRAGRAQARLERLAEIGLWTAPAAVAAMLDEARALPEPDTYTLVHGDLHLRHLLIGDDGGLAGVIDWIDVCRADPAIDLPLYWAYLTPAGREAFHAEYGPVGADRLLRARVLAVDLWATLADYARETGMSALGHEALAGVHRAVADLV